MRESREIKKNYKTANDNIQPHITLAQYIQTVPGQYGNKVIFKEKKVLNNKYVILGDKVFLKGAIFLTYFYFLDDFSLQMLLCRGIVKLLTGLEAAPSLSLWAGCFWQLSCNPSESCQPIHQCYKHNTRREELTSIPEYTGQHSS